MKIALYARVSKALEQNPENQYNPLLSWIKASGNEQVKDNEHPYRALSNVTSKIGRFYSLDSAREFLFEQAI